MKLTQNRLKQIIAEEMQKISEEGGQEDGNVDLKGKSAVRNYMKKDMADLVMNAKITSSEAPLFVEMVQLLLTIFDQKAVNPQQKERMSKLMTTAAGAKAE